MEHGLLRIEVEDPEILLASCKSATGASQKSDAAYGSTRNVANNCMSYLAKSTVKISGYAGSNAEGSLSLLRHGLSTTTMRDGSILRDLRKS